MISYQNGTRLLSLILAAVVALQTGCATMPGPPSEIVRGRLGVLGVEAIPSSPHGEFQTYAQGRASGAARGAATGAAQGLIEAFVQGARSSGGGPYTGAATAIAALLLISVGGITGGAIGAHQAVPAGTASDIQAQIDRVLANLKLADRLAAEVTRAAQARPDLLEHTLVNLGTAGDDKAAAHAGVDSIVAIEVTEAGFQGGRGAQPEVSFYSIARITVRYASDGMPRYQRDFRYDTEPRPFQAWFENGSVLLADSFQRAVSNLSERILDELFIVTDFPFTSGYWALPGTPEFGVCWFRPLYPAYRQRSMSASIWEGMRHPMTGEVEMVRNLIIYTPVDSLRPTLRWESFPRPRDIKPENKAVLHVISDITYDIKIWEATSGYPTRLVYQRTGLPQPEHTLAYDLNPHMRYYWTFRARYRFDGRPQTTRWAFSLAPAVAAGMPPGGTCDLDEIPPTNYFRFVTP